MECERRQEITVPVRPELSCPGGRSRHSNLENFTDADLTPSTKLLTKEKNGHIVISSSPNRCSPPAGRYHLPVFVNYSKRQDQAHFRRSVPNLTSGGG